MSLNYDAAYFLELQTQTGWGRTLASFAKWVVPQPGWSVLDVGCGPGLLPALFAGESCVSFGCDLDSEMFNNQPLHPDVAIANVDTLPFSSLCFDLVTASNLLFLLSDPVASLREMVRVVKPRGQIAILNPSEQMSVNAAAQLADKHNLEGLARDTLLNYAGRAERHNRWGKNEITSIFEVAGLRLVDIALKMGPGLVRFAKGMKE